MTTIAPKGTIVVTGANGGLGSAIAERLASSDTAADYRGIYAVRDAASVPSLMRILHRSSSHQYEVASLNLERLDDVRDLASNINSRVSRKEIPPITALVLSAGYQEFERQTWVEDGLDSCWVVNYLSQWLLSLLLLQSMDRENGRVVVLGSQTHDPYDKLNDGQGGYYDDPKWKTILDNSTEPIARGTRSSNRDDPSWCSGIRRYGASKLCVAMMIGELQERLDRDPLLSSICVLGIDPGWMATGIARRHPQYFFVRTIMVYVAAILSWLNPNGMFRTPTRSARDVMKAMLGSPFIGGIRPKGFYLKGDKLAEVSIEARDKEKRRMVWKDSVGYARLRQGETLLENWL